jgi:hypothetical protein
MEGDVGLRVPAASAELTDTAEEADETSASGDEALSVTLSSNK